MRFISTRVHGMVDYLMGLLLIVAPFIFGFATGGAAQWVPIILGVVMLAQAIMTKYELGLMHLIPMPTHLIMDLLSGVLLLISPWLFGFADVVYLPHVILGLLEIGASLTTEKEPRGLRSTTHHP
ncbi:SPW repeat domain-containing protein [Billgrantia saliphila]|uniref:SPW repeat domain-containing protein n=1 Tax=Billgrantia saliphila TaxID=1848458 RepID=UPI000CE3C3E1|nr:SPW repeat protein [Halomonas saliphila]